MLLLSFLVAYILMRTIKHDLARYESTDGSVAEDDSELGWKNVHGDVFRPPALAGNS